MSEYSNLIFRISYFGGHMLLNFLVSFVGSLDLSRCLYICSLKYRALLKRTGALPSRIASSPQWGGRWPRKPSSN